MNRDGEDGVRPAGGCIHQRFRGLALEASLLQDGVHLVLVVNLHLLKPLIRCQNLTHRCLQVCIY